MKITSAQAAKMLRQLNDELRSLQTNEDRSITFLAALDEDIESVRPKYDFSEMQKNQEETALKIRKLKHAVNIFNSTTVIPEFNITIDEMLVYLPQLNQRISKLSYMKDAMPKTRETGLSHSNSNIIDYRYANYDIEQVKQAYTELSDKLAKAQTALDYVNNTVEFEFEF